MAQLGNLVMTAIIVISTTLGKEIVTPREANLYIYKVLTDELTNSICVFYFWVLHPVLYLSNLFFMTPSIATKFQYINYLLFSFFIHYMFRPLRAILKWDILLDIWRIIF
jgi:hypothetical protein